MGRFTTHRGYTASRILAARRFGVPPNLMGCRPLVETLEDRLPPGDALSGMMWASSDTFEVFRARESIDESTTSLQTQSLLAEAEAEEKQEPTQEKTGSVPHRSTWHNEFQDPQLQADSLGYLLESGSGTRSNGLLAQTGIPVHLRFAEIANGLTAAIVSARQRTPAMAPTPLNVPPAMVPIADDASASSLHNFKTAPPSAYVADFVSTAATGVSMNDAGDVTGTSYPDIGCGSFCLPPQDTVVWRGGERIVLPSVPGFNDIHVRSINNDGWVAGFEGFPGTTTHAVVWKPNGNTYKAVDLGTLPGTASSEAIGIDNQGRVVGWSTTLNFPPNGSPFMWTEATGMVDLSAQGFPDEIPIAISPGGAVATPGYWYQLNEPASVTAMPPPPAGFYPPGTYPTAINDAGDQARFLVSTSTQNLRYLFRFHHEGTWQQISFAGNGNSSKYGVGSINFARDVTATVQGAGMIAHGPDGLTHPLLSSLSPAYQATSITYGGRMNSAGQILSQVIIGQSQRMMRLTPAETCTADCTQVSSFSIAADFVEDPNDPDHCIEGGNAHNETGVKLTLTSETGAKLRGVVVSGRFLDDYWTNAPVLGKTNRRGVVSFEHTGPCGVGAITFLVDKAVRGASVFDRTVGTVAGWAIPT